MYSLKSNEKQMHKLLIKIADLKEKLFYLQRNGGHGEKISGKISN